MSLIAPFALVPTNAMSDQTRPLSSDATQPATSFAQLLDAPKDSKAEKQKTPEHPAYSFAELGMFGLHASAFVADPEPAKTVHASVRPLRSSPTQSTIMQVLPPASVQLVSVPFLEGELTASAPDLSVQPAAGIAIVAVAKSTSLSPIATTPSQAKLVPARAEAQPKSPATKAALPQTRDTEPSAVSVVVSGPEDALQIALRTPSDTAPEVVKLRRLIETTVAHFEMDMAELHFNGDAIGSAFSLGGGMNGGTAR